MPANDIVFNHAALQSHLPAASPRRSTRVSLGYGISFLITSVRSTGVLFMSPLGRVRGRNGRKVRCENLEMPSRK